MLGFAAGVMMAASFGLLLAPSIEMAEELGQLPWLTAAIGFLGGGAFLFAVDKLLPHLHPGLDTSQAEGIKTGWQRSILLVLAITLHNIPEGRQGDTKGHSDNTTVGCLVGFTIMMILDVALG